MDISLELTGSDVKVASDGTLTTEEFGLETESGSSYDKKPSNCGTAFLRSALLQPAMSVLAGQPSMLVRLIQLEDSAVQTSAGSFFVRFCYSVT